jgi:valyl-tRNA synthetase
MPHVTEEIWSFLPGERGLLATSAWPESGAGKRDPEAEATLERAMATITAVRRYREESGVKPSAILPARMAAEGYGDTAASVARLARLDLTADGDVAAEIPVAGGSVQLLASEDFDPGAADAKVEARRAELQDEIARLEQKLANEAFVQKAPPPVVESERAKLADYRAQLDALGK